MFFLKYKCKHIVNINYIKYIEIILNIKIIMENEVKYILFNSSIPYICYKFKDIVNYIGLSESTIRKKLKISNKINEWEYLEILDINSISKLSDIAFFLISNDLCEYDFYKSLKDISEKRNIDLSSLYKYIKTDKYLSIGGNNPGRKNYSVEDGFSIYPISLIYYDIYS